MIEINGAKGEGGGQVLRTSLALSIVTGKPFRIFNIRAGREQPGLKAQHLTSVRAAAEVSRATVSGATEGSKELRFQPGQLRSGRYEFRVGTAGSTTLVLQSILPALLHADDASEVSITGGTHVMAAPSFDFLERAFLPQLAAMGAIVSVRIARYGFYPKGGGAIHAAIEPWRDRKPLALVEFAPLTLRARAYVSARLSPEIGKREIRQPRGMLNIPIDDAQTVAVDSGGPGNAFCLDAVGPQVTEVVTALGKIDRSAEKVGIEAAIELRKYIKYGAPVGPHLADQLLLPLALGAGGSFVTGPITGHTETNIETIGRFLDVPIRLERFEGRRNRVTVG